MRRTSLLVLFAASFAVGCSDDAASENDRATVLRQEHAAVRDALLAAGIEPSGFRVQREGPGGAILRFDVAAKDAVSIWERIRPLVPELGYYPVVREGKMIETEPGESDPAEAIASAASKSGRAVFEKWMVDFPDSFDDVEEGEWKESPPYSGWSVPFDVLTGKPLPNIWIALVPTRSPWEVLAYFAYGGWNGCPFPDEHVAVHKHWFETYGAEIVCLSTDVVEMRVARPPTDRTVAVALAREQFLYTNDLVNQGYGTLNNLASSLLGAECWYFWWD